MLHHKHMLTGANTTHQVGVHRVGHSLQVEHTDLRNDPKCGIMKTSGA